MRCPLCFGGRVGRAYDGRAGDGGVERGGVGPLTRLVVGLRSYRDDRTLDEVRSEPATISLGLIGHPQRG
jgi:hypothetical protein